MRLIAALAIASLVILPAGCSSGGNIATQASNSFICQQLNSKLGQAALTLAIQHVLNGQSTPADLVTINGTAAWLRLIAEQTSDPLKSRMTDAATAAEGVADGQITPQDTQAVTNAFARLREQAGQTCGSPAP